MPESKIIGYKKVFGFVMPDWVNERMVKNFAIGLFSLAAMFMVFLLVIRPNSETLKTKEKELKTEKEALSFLLKSKDSLDRLSSDLPERDLSRILLAMPQEYSPETAIFSLRRISGDTGVSIVSYNLPSGVLLDTTTTTGGTKKESKNEDMVEFSAFPIQITVAGPVENLLKFISRMETSLPFSVVSDLNVQEVAKMSRLSGDKTVQMELETRFFEARIVKVNLNKLQGFSDDELGLAGRLRDYTLITLPNTTGDSAQIPVATGSGSFFGF